MSMPAFGVKNDIYLRSTDCDREDVRRLDQPQWVSGANSKAARDHRSAIAKRSERIHGPNENKISCR